MKLYQKISLSICVLILVITSLLGITFLTVSTSIVTGVMEKGLIGQADSGARLVRNKLDGSLSSLYTIADLELTSLEISSTQKDKLINEMKRLQFLDFGIVTKDGIASYIKGGTTADLSDRDYVQQALRGVSSVSDVIISRVTGQPGGNVCGPDSKIYPGYWGAYCTGGR